MQIAGVPAFYIVVGALLTWFTKGIWQSYSNEKIKLDTAEISVYGKTKAIASQIKADLKEDTKPIVGLYFGNQWLVAPNPFNAWRYDDLVWVFYHQVEKKIILRSEKYPERQIKGIDSDQAADLIGEIKKHAPWVETRNNAMNEEKWKNRRQEFYREISEKRRNLSNSFSSAL
jgi:hypothetical protein